MPIADGNASGDRGSPWRWRLLLAGIALIASIAASRPAPAQVSLDTLVDVFVKIAEQGEFGDRSVGITRWARPINVAIAGHPTADQRVALEEMLPALAARMATPVRIAAPIASSERTRDTAPPIDFREPAAVFQVMYHLPGHGWTTYLAYGANDDVVVLRGDMLVIFAPHASAAQIARILRVDPALARDVASGASPCYSYFYTEPASHELKYAIVVLRTDVPDWARRRCLHEEMTQVMGLRNDVKGSDITLFDDMPMRRRTDLTAHDWMFLEVLYDPRMRPGLAGAELRRVARVLIAERMARRE